MHGIHLYIFLVAIALLLWTMRNAAGRLAPRAALAPMVFLATRTPVLIAWGFGAVAMFGLMWGGAVAHRHTALSDVALIAGLSAFCGLGYAALVVGPIFMVVRLFAAKPTFELEPGESIVLEATGSHFLRGEGRGGKVLVTTKRLGFRPHRFNVQLATWSVARERIKSVKREGQNFVVVETMDAEEWLVMQRPQPVVEALSAV